MEEIHVVHKKVKLKGLKQSYRFLHITDTHVVRFGEGETEARAEYARPRLVHFSEGGIAPDERLQSYIKYANEERVSAVLLTGDIIDFPSPENLEILRDALEALEMPYLYVAGNHDWSYFDDYRTEGAILRDRPRLRPFCGGSEDFHTLRIGELTFVALDNSMERYWAGSAERLKEVLEREEHVVVLQHIPLYCDTLHEDTVKKWSQDINLGGEGIVLDGSAEEIRRLLVESPAAEAIICGHLHFGHEDLLDGALPQYVTNLSSYGEVTVFEISGSEPS